MTTNEGYLLGVLRGICETSCRMRNYQRAYFTTRQLDALRDAKSAEREFDAGLKFVREVIKAQGRPPQQGTLF